ncbi:MAG: D-alanyl-D-alanine carboxypeptidase [Proteobacteria bacterium]|nr:D-alanyl-D-alanine carboxypeptidase [Pseudomonadota bacterium]
MFFVRMDQKSWYIRRVCVGFVFLAILCVGGADPALAKKHEKTKARRPSVQTTETYAALVLDADSGEVLYERNSRGRRYPASLTKMMTLYLTFQAIEGGRVRLDTQLPVSAKAASQSPSKLGLRAGQTIAVKDAILGLITESANDAAVVLAEGLAGNTSRFATLMTTQARALGMEGTVFQNPNGLPDKNQYTTARDMAMLAYSLINHYPGMYPYFSTQKFRYRGRVHVSHNHLMKRCSGMDGIKTGYIRASGFNLVASVERRGARIIAIVFGGKSAASRDAHLEKLIDEAFVLLNKANRKTASYVSFPTAKVAAAFPSRQLEAPVSSKRVAQQRPEKASAQIAEPKRPEMVPVSVLKPPESPYGGWGVQVGAFSDVDSAQKALSYMSATLSSLLGGAEQSLQKVTMKDGSAVYRARFTGLDQNTARQVCSYLVRRGHGCLVVSGL